MIVKPTLESEPVRIGTALTAALGATINVLGITLGWSGDLIAGLNVAAAGWVGLLGVWLRSKVTPVASIPPPEFA
tara:strand:+ start:3908 stop:4132 length:225 start_codon:yes stop_codon:yes gene_type:complete